MAEEAAEGMQAPLRSAKGPEEAGLEASVALFPSGIRLTTSTGMVSLPHVESGKRLSMVEVGQRSYSPLHVRPIDWLTGGLAYGGDLANTLAASTVIGAQGALASGRVMTRHTAASEAGAREAEAREAAARVASLAVGLRLGIGEKAVEGSVEGSVGEATKVRTEGPGPDAVAGIAHEAHGTDADDPFIASLLREHDDWGGTMSGGQRVKLELIRSIFLQDTCPTVLLIDEAFAPLDPASKQLVMRRLRSFCSSSLVLVIYHAEAREVEAREAAEVEVSANGSDGSAAAAVGNKPGVATKDAASNALSDVCGAGGGSFFDGVVHFSADGNVTFDVLADRCP